MCKILSINLSLQAILDFFKQFIDSISTDLQFAVDDIAEEDTTVVGVIWHLGKNMIGLFSN